MGGGLGQQGMMQGGGGMEQSFHMPGAMGMDGGMGGRGRRMRGPGNHSQDPGIGELGDMQYVGGQGHSLVGRGMAGAGGRGGRNRKR